MDTKMIAKKNKNIATKERLSNTLIKFIKSDKGSKFVKMLGYAPIKVLTSRFQAPDVARAGTSTNQMNIILNAVEKAGKTNLLQFNKIIDYTGLESKEAKYDNERKRFVENYQKNKTPFKLLPYEQKLLNMRDQWRVKTENGKPIVKTIKDDNPGNLTGVRLLYDKASGLPIYKFTPKYTGGLAWKMHAYEVHKMAKYDKRMAVKMEKDMKSDLFPGQVSQKYKMIREAHLEQLRRDLSNLYCPGNITVVVQDKENDSVKKIPIDTKMRLGILRKNNMSRGRTREQFVALSHAIMSKNPNSRLTCVHIDYTNVGYNKQKVIIPSLYGVAV